jgi:hypothetical protein
VGVKFLILVIDSKNNSGTSDEMVQIDAFNDKLRANGNWIYAWGLHGPEASKLIDNRNGLDKVENRSLVEAPENYSGFWLIEADDLDAATGLAKEGSKACNRRVELRPLH